MNLSCNKSGCCSYSGSAERIFKSGERGLMRKRKREQTRGIRKNFKFKSSKMAINASKTAKMNSNINL